jgi:hypothetical protein
MYRHSLWRLKLKVAIPKLPAYIAGFLLFEVRALRL